MQNSLFDLQNRYASLSEAGDPLERLNAVIDWELFRPTLECINPAERKSTAGRKPTCRVLMFKMLILQRLNNLSDERLQYQVSDRLSFMRFLGRARATCGAWKNKCLRDAAARRFRRVWCSGRLRPKCGFFR